MLEMRKTSSLKIIVFDFLLYISLSGSKTLGLDLEDSPQYLRNGNAFRRILYVGSASNRDESVSSAMVAFPSYFQPQRPYHVQHYKHHIRVPRLNIFGHNQHHQEVSPSRAATSADSTTSFRPSPPDPLRQNIDSADEEEFYSQGHGTPSEIRNTKEIKNHGGRFIYALDAEEDDGARRNDFNFQNEGLNSIRERPEDGVVRALPEFHAPEFRRPEFPYQAHRNRGLLQHLYQSYVDNLNNPDLRSLEPIIEITPKSPQKQKVKSRVLSDFEPAPLGDVVDHEKKEYPPIEKPKIRTPIQGNSFPSEEFRGDEKDAQNFSSNRNTFHINKKSTQRSRKLKPPKPTQESVTSAPQDHGLRKSNHIHRRYQQKNIKSALRPTVSPFRNFQKTVDSEKNKHDLDGQIFATTLPIISSVTPRIHYPLNQPRGTSIQDSDPASHKNQHSPLPVPLRQVQLAPNRQAEPFEGTDIQGLPNFFPFAFEDEPELNHFFNEPINNNYDTDPDLTFQTTTSKTSEEPKHNSNAGRSLYPVRNSVKKVGGLYASYDVNPQHHIYGVPMNAQVTPVQKLGINTLNSNKRVRPNRLRFPNRKIKERRKNGLKSFSSTIHGDRDSVTNLEKVTSPKKIFRHPSTLRRPKYKRRKSFSLTTEAPLPKFSTEHSTSIIKSSVKVETEVRNGPGEQPQLVLPKRRKTRPKLLSRRIPNIRKQIARPRQSFEKSRSETPVSNTASKPETSGRPPNSILEQPNLIAKKFRKNSRLETLFRRRAYKTTPTPTTTTVKPPEFPLKFSSRYKTDPQIFPTTVPTVPFVPESNGGSQLGIPFSSKPRQVFTKTETESSTISNGLPPSVLLSSEDVIRNRKPPRRIKPGSPSERLKALQSLQSVRSISADRSQYSDQDEDTLHEETLQREKFWKIPFPS